jgi:CheY-like chemotaxis protein
VVEDEAAVREMAVESLQGLGYTTVACTTASDALDRLRTDERVDLLFSDVVMPGGINGFQLAAEARQMRPSLKILLTSGYTGSFDPVELGDLPLLTKPYDRDGLAAQLSTMLRE